MTGNSQAHDDAGRTPERHEALARLAATLSTTLGEDSVLTGERCAEYTVQEHVPAVVVRPADAEQVAEVLARAAEVEATVVPWGNGTRQSIGYPPSRCDLALSLERLNRVVAYDPADLTVTVEAGISHAALRSTLAASGQMLPLDVPLPALATVGGTLATSLAGLRRGRYGAPRDLTLGLRVADATGTLLKAGGRVVKNVTGYDMTKLYLGSLGTLAVIVEASLKLVPLPETEQTLVCIYSTPADALAAARQLDALALRPAALTVLHAGALQPLAVRAPTARQVVLLAARFPGESAAVRRAVADARDLLMASHVIASELLADSAQQEFWSEADDALQMRSPTKPEALIRVSALPMECEVVLSTAQALADEHALDLLWLADAIAGSCWLRLRSPESAEATDAATVEFGEALRRIHTALAFRWRNAVIFSCAPELKADLALWGADPSALDLMREVKRRFDPKHLLNPGRFVGGI